MFSDTLQQLIYYLVYIESWIFIPWNILYNCELAKDNGRHATEPELVGTKWIGSVTHMNHFQDLSITRHVYLWKVKESR